MPTKTINKSAWIRSQPLDTPAKELVAKAKKEGFKLSEAMVYTTRSEMKKKAAKGSIAKAKPGPKPKLLAEGRGTGNGIEAMIRNIVRDEVRAYFSKLA